jgi:putative Holliday junction resolvase
MQRIAALDFGLKRIGLALSDERHLLATPIKTIAAGRTVKESAALLAKELAAHLPLHSLVIGLPLHLNGKESPLSLQVRALADELKSLLSLEIVLWDERLSSAQVARTLREAGLSRKKQAPLLDKQAAAAILQNYLDSCL